MLCLELKITPLWRIVLNIACFLVDLKADTERLQVHTTEEQLVGCLSSSSLVTSVIHGCFFFSKLYQILFTVKKMSFVKFAGAFMKGRGVGASGGQNQIPIAAASKSNHVSLTAKGPAFHPGGAPHPLNSLSLWGSLLVPRLRRFSRKKQTLLSSWKRHFGKSRKCLIKSVTSYAKSWRLFKNK